MNSSSRLRWSSWGLERIWTHGFTATAITRYGVGIAVALSVSMLRIGFNGLWGADFPFIFYFPIILFTGLQQVFWILLQNDIKFTPRGGLITVSSRDENGQLCVAVSDTGCGIEPVNLEKIFEPFTGTVEQSPRLEMSLGSGSVCSSHGRSWLHMRGSLIAASDGTNRGATFTVSLPVSRELRKPPPPPKGLRKQSNVRAA